MDNLWIIYGTVMLMVITMDHLWINQLKANANGNYYNW